MAKLIKCEGCGHDVSSKAATCPKCGNPIMDVQRKIGGFIGLGLFALFLVWFVFHMRG